MGVGGNFWELLKPYARTEGFDFLRNKRVAVDLSYWIVQHETAIKGHARNPHIRLTFFRTINLFSKFGAFPVFVVDGTPSPLKSQARILRFFRASGIGTSSLPVQEEGVSVERNKEFLNCVQQCVELLTLLGMPVLKARGEAEALCAQLNMEGSVDACITSDSDAFLFGAKCVIKSLKPNFQEPFECYQMSDIETGLGLRRNHLIAISLLVGNDHDLNGVQGIGLDTALRFVKSFSEDDVLNRLHLIGRGDMLHHQGSTCASDFAHDSDENMKKARSPHCSHCGHPGSKTAHLKHACVYCSPSTSEGCMLKPAGFKCACTSCDLDKKEKEQKRIKTRQIRVCEKIAKEPKFPNDVIIDMYLCNDHGNFTDFGPTISWENPNTEMLVDYLAYHQNWEPSYIRQILIPLLSTIFLRGMASNRTSDLLYGQYEFDSIQRVKSRFGHQFYMVNWKKASPANNDSMYKLPSEEPDDLQGDQDECIDLLDEPDVTKVHSEKGCLFMLTDENIELVKAAYPEKVAQFLLEKEQKEMNSRKKKSSLKSLGTPDKNSISPRKKSVQLNITEFYRASKVMHQEKKTESEKANGLPEGKRRSGSPIPKSVRRRLLFG